MLAHSGIRLGAVLMITIPFGKTLSLNTGVSLSKSHIANNFLRPLKMIKLTYKVKICQIVVLGNAQALCLKGVKT